jgi:hypothetical protein
MDFLDKVNAFCAKAFHSLGAITERMDTTSWAILSILALVSALIFLKGNSIKGA